MDLYIRDSAFLLPLCSHTEKPQPQLKFGGPHKEPSCRLIRDYTHTKKGYGREETELV